MSTYAARKNALVNCARCQATPPADSNYCNRCGAPLPGGPGAGTVTERRVVSVLFADLQGFTAFAADRDPEEVREVLSRYCDVANNVVARYGGITEKFIGDAVMAVWGTPVAREDDPDRAVKAAFELVAAVSEIEYAPDQFLALRAGVVTGEAAVTLGAMGQGMVAGDVVNTASRIQSVAPAGCVFVDDSTHAATEMAIVYSDAGDHKLKGKAQPVHVWKAESVARTVEGIEPPFVARDRELRTIKDVYQKMVDASKPAAVSIIGRAGIGKTRLRTEFQRYLTTVPDGGKAHVGFCAPFGEGAAFGAITEIFQKILGVAPEAGVETIKPALSEVLGLKVQDAEELNWLMPRVLQAYVQDTSNVFERDELFSAWRTFLEAAALQNPLVLVVEELQWADKSLAAFLRSILTWSVSSRIMVMTVVRSLSGDDAAQDIPQATHIVLSDLAHDALEEMVQGLAPGLNETFVDQLVASAEGLPLYVVETMRMLASSGMLSRQEDRYRVLRQPQELAVPHTVQLVVASRLDALPPEALQVVKTAAVLGMRVHASTVALIDGRRLEILTPVLKQLVQDEVFTFENSAGGAEGFYQFTQRLLRDTAYDRISKKERVQRHLSAARILGSGAVEAVSPEIVASHYLQAHALDPALQDALDGARATLVAAVGHARASGSLESALQYCTSALDISAGDSAAARLAADAGEICHALARFSDSYAFYERARQMADGSDPDLELKATVQAARVAYTMGRNAEALSMLRDGYARLYDDAPIAARALLAHRLSWSEFLAGNVAAATPLCEEACELYAWANDVEGMGWANGARGSVLAQRGRRLESWSAFELARRLASAPGPLLMQIFLRIWEADARTDYGDFTDVERLESEISDLARRLGSEGLAATGRGLLVTADFYRGDWDAALERSKEIEVILRIPQRGSLSFHGVGLIYSRRGRQEDVERLAGELDAAKDTSMVYAAMPSIMRGAAALDNGDFDLAWDLSWSQLERLHNTGPIRFLESAFGVLRESAWLSQSWERLERALEAVQSEWRGRLTPSLRAQIALARAQLMGHGGTTPAAAEFASALAQFREVGQPYDLGVALASNALWAKEQRLEFEPIAAEARRLFLGLGAKVWLERLDAEVPEAATFAAAS